MLDFPDQEGGVERCDCACNYMERQPPKTGLIQCVHGMHTYHHNIARVMTFSMQLCQQRQLHQQVVMIRARQALTAC